MQALQDYDYMGKHIRLSKDPFYVTGERFIERCMLQVAMKNRENEIDPLQYQTLSANGRQKTSNRCLSVEHATGTFNRFG